MWKGLAWLMLLYGLLATAAAVDAGDRQRGLQEMFTSWQQANQALRERTESAGINPAPVLRFDGHDPLVAVSGAAEAVVVDDGENAWLEWTPDRNQARLDLLGLLIAAGRPGDNGLALRLNANYKGQVIIGVMESDGSSYMVFPERLPGDWTSYEFPLDTMELGDDSEDENGRLDPEQVDMVLIGYLDVQDGGQGEAESRVISVDDVMLGSFRDNPLFPDFRPGAGGPDGPAGPGGPEGRRPRDVLRERISE